MAKILIVDDSAMSRRGPGWHDRALGKYYLEKPDYWILIMKGMLGLEVHRKIRLMDEDARVIVAT